MDLEITPEPSAEERAAVVAALERLFAVEQRRSPDAWWQAGVGGGSGEADEEPG